MGVPREHFGIAPMRLPDAASVNMALPLAARGDGRAVAGRRATAAQWGKVRGLAQVRLLTAGGLRSIRVWTSGLGRCRGSRKMDFEFQRQAGGLVAEHGPQARRPVRPKAK